jgi:hypothetical protein
LQKSITKPGGKEIMYIVIGMLVMKKLPLLFGLLFLLHVLPGCNKTTSQPDNAWTSLLDSNLSKWDKFIGVPHYSITSLPGYPKGDGMNGTPIGLNKDPLQVFKVEQIDGSPVLHVSGEIYGGLSTREEYGNYHFRAEFKWGERKYEPRLNEKRDNGILYHAYGPHGAFWNVWMNAQEMQVQEGDMGDYIALGPACDITAVDTFADNEQGWMYRSGAGLKMFGDQGISGRCRRMKDFERPLGEWNTLELICLGAKSIHVVNGHVVNVTENIRIRQANGGFVPLTKGKLQLQSEGAEAYYKNIFIQAISEIPEPYR